MIGCVGVTEREHGRVGFEGLAESEKMLATAFLPQTLVVFVYQVRRIASEFARVESER